MDPERLIILVVAVELLTLGLLWVIALSGAHRIRRRRIDCPRDGRTAHLLVDETVGRAPAATDVVRCSLLESNPNRSCERECVHRLAVPRRARHFRRLVIFGALLACGATGYADDNMTGRKELQMARCPSAVSGATTRVEDVAGGVAVTVRAPHDPIAQQEIRRRVQAQLEIVDQPERGAIEHTGLGTGSGRYGFCPGMVQHTSLDVEWTSDGARMIIRADDRDDVQWLRSTTRKRVRALDAKLRTTAAR
jgi:hypothetical protein